MSYSVRYQVNLEDIPEDARPEIVRTFQQISEVVGTVPLTSPFWSSMLAWSRASGNVFTLLNLWNY